MKYIFLLFFSSCSYSIHETNITTQNKIMLRYEQKYIKQIKKARAYKSGILSHNKKHRNRRKFIK